LLKVIANFLNFYTIENQKQLISFESDKHHRQQPEQLKKQRNRCARYMIKDVIFDLNGVIAESDHIHIEAAWRVLLSRIR